MQNPWFGSDIPAESESDHLQTGASLLKIHILLHKNHKSLSNPASHNYNLLFSQSESKSDMVATFLAVLELIKGNRITLDDENEKIKLLDGDAKFGSQRS